MPLNNRAKRRITILIVLFCGVAVLGAGAWWGRQFLKEQRAQAARIRGIEALENRQWAEALPDLSTAVVSDPMDLEALRGLATARRRVPAPNNQHLRDSMKFATRAVEVAKQLQVPEDVLVETLLDLARIEYANGARLNLEETSAEIIELDPSNTEAFDALYEVKLVRGLFVPDQLQLMRKGGRSDREWLQSLRMAGDTSALRWAVERLVADPNLRNREAVIQILHEGRFEDLQRVREGMVRETLLDVVGDWIAQGEAFDPSLHLLLAVEEIRVNDLDSARAALRVVEAADVVDADLLIRAAALREALGNPTDRRRAEELLARAEEVPSVSPEAAGLIAIRHWSALRPEKALDVLATSAEANPYNVELILNGLLMSALVDIDDLDQWLDYANELLPVGTLNALEAETLEMVMALVELARRDRITLQDVADTRDVFEALDARVNPLLQTLMGDIHDRVGLRVTALDHWRRASLSLNGRSLEVARRLVPSLIQNQELYAAFESSLKLASNLRSVASIQILCRAWLALERAGIDVRDVQPTFDMWETPRELAASIYEELRARDQIATDSLVLLAEAIALEGDKADLVDLTRAGIESGIDSGTLITLGRINRGADTGLTGEILNILNGLDLDTEAARRRLLLELDHLRDLGRYAEVEEKASREVPIFWRDDQDAIDRIICVTLTDNAVAQDLLDASVIGRCIDELDSIADLMKVLRFAITKRDESVAEAAYAMIRSIAGDRSPTAALANAEIVIAFAAQDPVRVKDAILLADERVSDGAADVDLQIALTRLLRLGPRPVFDRAIEVLRESVLARPGRFDLALMLIDVLQETGQYDEAQEYLQQIRRRRDQASPQARRLMSALLAGQGDVGGTVELSCDIAAETNDVFDALQCVNALLMGGEEQKADAMLASLYANPDRPIEVDLAYARRLASLGRLDEVLEVVRTAPGYADRSDYCFEIARTAFAIQEWEVAERHLAEAEGIDPLDRRLKYLRAEFELARPDGDRSVADAVLADLVADPGASAEELRAAALLRMPDQDLRSGVPEIVRALRVKRPIEANFIELTFDATRNDGGFASTEDLRERAKQILANPLATASMWLLAIELERIEYVNCLEAGKVFESAAAADRVVSLLQQAGSRFAIDAVFPRQLSEMLLVLGDYEGALLNGREALRRSPGTTSANADHMALARILVNLESYAEIVETFEPFVTEMLESPLDYRRSVTLLVLGHLGAGEVEEAWQILKAIQGEIGSDVAAYLWLTSIPKAPASKLNAAYELLRGDESLVDWTLLDSPSLIQALVNSADPANVTVYREWRDGIAASDLGLTEALRVAAIADGIELQDRPVELLTRLQGALDMVPAGLRDQILGYEQLDPADQRAIGPIRFLMALALNNIVAVWSEAVLSASGDPAGLNAFAAVASSAARQLEIVGAGVPQMVDSLAIYALAQGRTTDAIGLAADAVTLDPSSPANRFTLARALFASGDAEAARDEASKAVLLARRYPNENIDLLAKLDVFLGTI